MKKLVLSIIVMSLTVGSFAQNRINVLKRKTITTRDGETRLADLSRLAKPSLPVRVVQKGATPINLAISATAIGNSPNHLTVGFGAKNALFAQPEINSAFMIYRNDPSTTGGGFSGDYNFALSTDGGITWPSPNAGPIYVSSGVAAPPFANGRYPQGLLYNPTGNTNPNNAYICFAGSGLAGTNGAWGGIPNGAVQIQTGSTPYQAEILNDRTQVANTFIIAPTTNKTYFMDAAVDVAGTTDYVDSLALFIGVWNATNNAYDYTYSPVYAPVGTDVSGAKYIFEGRAAFAPNGMIGYIAVLGHPDFALYADSVIVPMIYKTTDGGANWTSLGAINLAGLSTVLPAAIDYSTWNECDLVVDNAGNAHLVVACGVSANDNTFSTVTGDWGIFDIYCTNGGLVSSDWHAQLLGFPETFEYIWASADNATPEDSRPQASTTWAGDKVFLTWFDTDPAVFVTTENSNPDCWAIAFNPSNGMWSTATNMTAGSSVEGSCSFGSVSPYVFGASGTYTIPVAFQALADPTIGLATTTHMYVSGIEITDAQINVAGSPVQLALITGVNEINAGPINSLSVYPNPVHGSENTLAFSLDKSSKVSIELVNAIGQVSKTVDFGVLNAGEQKLKLDVEGLQAGFYIVKVKAGDFTAVHKINIK